MNTLPLTNPEYLYLKSAKAAVNLARKSLPSLKNAVILDLGCGNQPWKAAFTQKASKYFGVDLEPKVNPSGVMLAEKLAFKKQTFDLILSIALLEHANDPKLVLREISRTLKSNGSLILQTHALYPYHPNPVDHWRWTHTGLKKIFAESGLAIQEIYPSGNTLTTYLTFNIQALSLILAKLRIPSLLRKIVIVFSNLLGNLISYVVKPQSAFHQPGNLIISYTLVAKKMSSKRSRESLPLTTSNLPLIRKISKS